VDHLIKITEVVPLMMDIEDVTLMIEEDQEDTIQEELHLIEDLLTVAHLDPQEEDMVIQDTDS